MEEILKLLHHQRPNPNILATSHTLKLKTSAWTWLISLPPANVTVGVQQPTVSGRKKASKSVALGTQNPCNKSQAITTENGDSSLITARNDCLLNSYNPVQLSGWRANVDMQYVVSRRRVINYVAKYATKSEPRSKSLKTVYSTIMKSLKDDDKLCRRS